MLNQVLHLQTAQVKFIIRKFLNFFILTLALLRRVPDVTVTTLAFTHHTASLPAGTHRENVNHKLQSCVFLQSALCMLSRSECVT